MEYNNVHTNRYHKHHALLRDVLIPYHPMFANNSANAKLSLQDPELFNVEHGVEVAMAAASDGLYTFIDGHGYDNSDMSDTKTVSVNNYTCKAELTNVENKIGALRIVIYNPIMDATHFMYIPASHVRALELACYGKNSHKTRMIMQFRQYSSGWYTYNKYDRYLVPCFKTLAKMK